MIDTLPRVSHNLRNSIRDLHRTQHRDEQQEYLAEGPHVLQELLRAGHLPAVVIVRDDADEEMRSLAFDCRDRNVAVFASGRKDMELMSDAAAPQAILAAVPYHAERPVGNRVLALDAVADPGNVGTIIRCAAWFGFTDVVLGIGSADVYNPKTVRSTAGALAHVNLIRKRELDAWLSSLDERPRFAAVARGGAAPERLASASNFVLVVGSEAHGVHPSVLDHCTEHLTIPGSGGSESLNAAMATAIFCYEGRLR
ncbi:MAG: RNA methyltransferase [Ignavibacteriae bacterium]|nr:MAG: RNA methyltransferase [Ignavibacteriota bacterium]